MNVFIYYRPLSAVYYALLYHVFSNIPFFYHLMQILLHMFVTILIFFFLRVFLTRKLSLILSLFFLVHPINIESVAAIAITQDQLAALFGLSAFLLTIHMNKPNMRKKVIVFIFLLFSILSKESGVLFLLFLLLYMYFFKRKYLKEYIVYGISVIGIYFLSLRFFIGHIYFEKLNLIPI